MNELFQCIKDLESPIGFACDPEQGSFGVKGK